MKQLLTVHCMPEANDYHYDLHKQTIRERFQLTERDGASQLATVIGDTLSGQHIEANAEVHCITLVHVSYRHKTAGV